MNRHQLDVALLDKKYQQRLRILSFSGAAVLAIAALWSAGVPMMGWLDKEPTPEQPPQTTQMPIPVASPITAASSDVPSSMLAGTDTSVSKVPLVLKLMSTFPGRNANEGTAAIGVTRENPQTYTAGALLANGARLREIHRDYVVLERDGLSTRLYLDAKKNSKNDLSMVGGPQTVRPAITASHEPLTDYLRPSPLYEGQVLRGYQVYAGQKLSVFFKLGLQEGDLITSLDRAPFSDPVEAVERFQQLMSGAALVAAIDRKGELKTITLDGSIIVADLARASDAAQVQSPIPMGM